MRIAAANVQKFHYRSNVVPDSEGHGHPGPEQDAVQSLLTITGEPFSPKTAANTSSSPAR